MNVVVDAQHKLANQSIVASVVYGLTFVWHTDIVDPTSTRVYVRPCSFHFEIAMTSQIGCSASQSIVTAVRLFDWCGVFTELCDVVCNIHDDYEHSPLAVASANWGDDPLWALPTYRCLLSVRAHSPNLFLIVHHITYLVSMSGAQGPSCMFE